MGPCGVYRVPDPFTVYGFSEPFNVHGVPDPFNVYGVPDPFNVYGFTEPCCMCGFMGPCGEPWDPVVSTGSQYTVVCPCSPGPVVCTGHRPLGMCSRTLVRGLPGSQMYIMALIRGVAMPGPHMGLLGTWGGMTPMVILQLAVYVRRLPQILCRPRRGARCRVWTWLPLLG